MPRFGRIVFCIKRTVDGHVLNKGVPLGKKRWESNILHRLKRCFRPNIGMLWFTFLLSVFSAALAAQPAWSQDNLVIPGVFLRDHMLGGKGRTELRQFWPGRIKTSKTGCGLSYSRRGQRAYYDLRGAGHQTGRRKDLAGSRLGWADRTMVGTPVDQMAGQEKGIPGSALPRHR